MHTIIKTPQSRLLMGKCKMDKLREYLFNLDIPRHTPIHEGRSFPKRNTLFFSDSWNAYSYSGAKIDSAVCELSVQIRHVLNKINTAFDSDYNGVLINRYNDGRDCLGQHSDSEVGLGNSGVVALVVGAERIFRIRGKFHQDFDVDLFVPDGSILWMTGRFQEEFTHGIPAMPWVKQPRISATFRVHGIKADGKRIEYYKSNNSTKLSENE